MFTGRGYATEAVHLFLDYVRANTALSEVYAISLSSNKASRRVLEKCGFETIFEGEWLYQGKRRKIVKAIRILNG